VAREDAKVRDVVSVAALDDQLPAVWVDPLQMEQVCINLLRNAMDAVQGLAGERRRVSVTTEVTPDGESVIVRVADSGTGIDAEKLATLFDPFISSKRSGMGLGLAICRSLVEAHQGRISASSIPGSGSTFEFRLPVKEDDGSPLNPEPAEAGVASEPT